VDIKVWTPSYDSVHRKKEYQSHMLFSAMNGSVMGTNLDTGMS